ncbi:hypothetical protein BHE74_00011399 [Ensete ventricosum]|nr:hypothetical protein BHE74_00011399 [Ensete ventricosum]RZR91001.1 hypothetical protein BHM03_00019032 [Ensete ventricosum]
MGVAVCLSIDQGKLLEEHRGVEAGGRKGRGSDNSLDSTTQKQSVGQKGGGPGRRYKVTDGRAMGLATTCYCKSGTSVKSSIPCYHGGRALVVKGAEEVENAKANSKYQDKTEGQRPENFIRQVSNKRPPNLNGMRRLRYWRSARINKDQHNSTNPTPESIISELKQHGGSEFDYSTTAAESSWEPRGVLQPKQEIEDSAKGEEMQRLQRL